MLKIFGIALVLGLCTRSPAARAEGAQEAKAPVTASRATDALQAAPAPAPTPTAPSDPLLISQSPERSYGWQVLATDLTATTLLLTSIALDSNELDRATIGHPNVPVVLSVGIFMAAPPAIHFAHGRVGAGLGSLALRAAGPPLLGLLARSTCEPQSRTEDYNDCPNLLALVGVVVGAFAASAIDIAALSWDTPKPVAPASPAFGFSPILSADGKRGELLVFGTF